MNSISIFRNKAQLYVKEILAGFTIALGLIPEVIAFAVVAGVSPTLGLYGAVIMGISSAVFGGRPGLISGASGAVAVVIIDLVADHGVDYLFGALFLAGIFQILFGILKFGKFIRIVPYPVIFGFINGLIILIIFAQLDQFRTIDFNGNEGWLSSFEIIKIIFITIATLLIIKLFPYVTKAIPSALVAIILVTYCLYFFNIPTKDALDFAIHIEGNDNFIHQHFSTVYLPSLPLTWQTLEIIFPYALIIATVGLIESLVTLSILDELTQTRGKSNKECIAQGIGNMSCSVLGGMGGCAMIGQSIHNIKYGGRGRLSSLTAALALLIFTPLASNFIESIPVAALLAVVIILVINTIKWTISESIKKVSKGEVLILISVTILTLVYDVTIAVIYGIVLYALRFSWIQSKKIHATSQINRKRKEKVYFIYGPLFFGSTNNFLKIFKIKKDPKHIILDFKNSRILDQSGLDTISKLNNIYKENNKIVKLRHLSPECIKLLKQSNVACEINLIEDPSYKVASDLLD
ncbi:SulP family inorganic anion transporter [Paraphotobacterium marinum]|uniref:SulP family inorganic anion transporter n=1 Tax=Paraphotobacterium marinum TaxID=1755811 RepID=UPI001CEF8E14|nr:SulP family inorganic anion transporter [Paraphotobacterium marinum]